MTTGRPGYWRRLWDAFVGRDVQPIEVSPPDEETVQLRARVASLEMDLAERDRRISEMRSEYAALEEAKGRAASTAGDERLDRLFRKMAGPLANLAALAAAAEAGEEVEVGDLLSLIRSLEKELGRAGLERIGHVGEQTQFDVACHQRMSGGAVEAGTLVTVHLPGYRAGDKVLAKAMVSAVEEHAGEE